VTVSLKDRPRYEEDHEAFRASVQRVLESEVVPHLDGWRAAGRFPEQLALLLGEQGFLGTTIPEELGGGGVDDPRFIAVLVEEAVTVGATGLALVLAHHCGVCVPALLRLPDGEARSAALRGAATGDLLAAPVVLDGRLESQGVPGASVADVFVVSRTGPEGRRTIGLPPRGMAEVEEVARSLGGLEAGTADVRFTRAALDTGPVTKDESHEFGRDLDLWTAVVAAAGAQQALELAVTYVGDRKVFGRPLAEFENTRLRLGEVAAEIMTVRMVVDLCLAKLIGGTLAETDAAVARMVAVGAYGHAVDQALQLHGGYGYMREYPISHAYGDARFLRQAAATTGDPRTVVASAIGL
jgi:acyl-CoA dehydrogenase